MLFFLIIVAYLQDNGALWPRGTFRNFEFCIYVLPRITSKSMINVCLFLGIGVDDSTFTCK